MNRGSWGKKIVFFVIMAALAIVVFGEIVMLLWNNVLVAVTSVHPVNFTQALGILVLSKILFGGFRGAWGAKRNYWKGRMTQKWNNMTPEEREKFKQEWQKRCGRSQYKGWNAGVEQEDFAKPESDTSR